MIQTITNLKIGHRYKIGYETGTNVGTKVYVTDGSITDYPNAYTYVAGLNELEFTALATSSYLRFRFVNGENTGDNFTIKEILPVSTTYSMTEGQHHSNVFTLTKVRTEAEMLSDNAYLEANQEAIQRLRDTEPIPDLSFALSDIQKYYPCTEGTITGPFIQDVIADIGANIIDAAWYSGATTKNATIAGGVVSINTTVDGYAYNQYAMPRGDIVIYGFTVSNYVSGQVFIELQGGTVSIDEVVSGNGKYLFARKIDATSSELNRPIIRAYNSAGFVGDVSNFYIHSVDATEIANYTSSCKITLQNTDYGLIKARLTLDIAGRPTSVIDNNLLEFNGDGRYSDLKWKPSATEDWTAEIVIAAVDNTNYTGHRLCGSDANGVWIGTKGVDGATYARVFGTTSEVVGNGLICHIVVPYNSTLQTFDVYRNDATTATSVSATGPGSAATFLLGKEQSGTYKFYEDIGFFKVHKGKAMTADDVSVAYTAARVLYPTLPLVI